MPVSTITYITCFCSVPFDGHRQFVKKEIVDSFFKEFKRGLKVVSKGDNFRKMYDPEVYYIWGKYDLFILAQIDNFEFASRFFRYSRSHKFPKDSISSEVQNFDYRVNVCFDSKNNTSELSLRLPYISIVQLKINSAFLIGNGEHLLRLIKTHIGKKIEEFFDENEYTCEYILSDTYSYHELNLIIKSDSIQSLKNIILEIQKIRLFELESKEILNESLFLDLVKGKYSKNKEVANHIFESSLTTFGVDFYLYDEFSNLNPEVKSPAENEFLTFYSKWSIKPGHIKDVIGILEEIKLQYPDSYQTVELVAGKGDLLLKHNSISGKSPLNNFPQFILSQNNKLGDHVLETYTTVAFSPEFESDPLDANKQKHYHIHDKLKNYTIDLPVINTLRRKLKALWIPKILGERILRIIANYNNAILSADMYVFYVEIYPFIKRTFIGTVDVFYENRKEPNYRAYFLKNILEQSCNDLETSFENRFYQSYWTSEVPEASTDFSGGIHNLIGVYDSVYKGLNNLFYSYNSNASFLYIKSENQVRTSFNTLKVNYLHLVQPYNFCSIVFHETLNFAFEKFYLTNYQSTDDGIKQFISDYLSLLKSANIKLRVPFATDTISKKHNDFKLFASSSDFQNTLRDTKEELIHKNLTEFINSTSLRYFVTDFMNFEYLFDSDYDFFKEISWKNFFQIGYVYDSPAIVNKHYFVTFAIRMMLIKLGSLENYQTFNTHDFKNIFPKDSHPFENLIKEFNSDIIRLAKALNKNVQFQNWMKMLRNVSNDGKHRFGIIDELKLGVDEEILRFLKGDVTFFDLQNSLVEYISSERYSILYLEIIRSYLRLMNSQTSLLVRNFSGTPQPNTNGIYIDPLGGLFVSGEKERKMHLASTVRLYKLLFHISCLYKRHYMVFS